LPWALGPCSTEQGLCSSVLYTTEYRKEGTGVLSLNAWGLLDEQNRGWEENASN